jgi:hypothetical protein
MSIDNLESANFDEIMPTNHGKNWIAEEYVSSEYLIETGWYSDGSWFKKKLKDGMYLNLAFNMASRIIKSLWITNENHPEGAVTHTFYSRVFCPNKTELEHLLELIQPEIEDAIKPLEYITIVTGANNYRDVVHGEK